MPYGLLTARMKAVLASHVAGTEVWDLGSGDLERAAQLRAMGARSVVAVDKVYDVYSKPKRPPEGVEILGSLFCDVIPPKDGFEVVFLGWPANHRLPGLVSLLQRAKRVVYLGSNMDGTACGSPDLFEHLVGREVLDAYAISENTLAVYGGPCGQRTLLAEEWTVLHGGGTYWSLAEATERALAAGPGALYSGGPASTPWLTDAYGTSTERLA